MATTTESTQTTQIVMKHRGKCGDRLQGDEHYSLVELAAGQMFSAMARNRDDLRAALRLLEHAAQWEGDREEVRSLCSRLEEPRSGPGRHPEAELLPECEIFAATSRHKEQPNMATPATPTTMSHAA